MFRPTLDITFLVVWTVLTAIHSVTASSNLYIGKLVYGEGEPKYMEVVVANAVGDLSEYCLTKVHGLDAQPPASCSELRFPPVFQDDGVIMTIAANEAEFVTLKGFSPDYESSVADFSGDFTVFLFRGTGVFGRISGTYVPPSNGGGGGDPHFSTWDGIDYSYHGQCDLVMLQSPTFGDGMGLDVHIRTEIVDNWSRISNIAIRIGTDILEVLVDGNHYFNGVYGTVDDIPSEMAQSFALSARRTCQGKNVVEDSCQSYKHHYEIDLGHRTKIETISYSAFLNFNVQSLKNAFAGMIGTGGKPGMVARDGKTVLQDPIQMGDEWQVRDDEPLLFQDTVHAPQYPAKCILPAANAKKSIVDTIVMGSEEWKKSRHLRQGFALIDQAEAACADVHDMKACISDVITMGDADLALLYVEEDEK